MIKYIMGIVVALGLTTQAHAVNFSFTNDDVLAVFYSMSETYDHDNIGYDVYGEQFWGDAEEVESKLRADEINAEELSDMMADFYHNGGRLYDNSATIVQYVDNLQAFMNYMAMLNENPQAHEPYEFWDGMTTMEYYLGTVFSWLDGEEEWKSTVFYNVAKLKGLENFLDGDGDN